ncbi:MAG TPA: hypothetical protein VL123_04855 [Candidatus Udaeobacter sp.]|nr:hypothetical protein [Candidatus Udaeobacter sp.]
MTPLGSTLIRRTEDGIPETPALAAGEAGAALPSGSVVGWALPVGAAGEARGIALPIGVAGPEVGIALPGKGAGDAARALPGSTESAAIHTTASA